MLGLRFQQAGTEHVPTTGGALLAFNHVSYVDFILGGLAAQPSKRLVRFMAKREVFDHALAGPVMRSMHHISVDRGDGAGSLEEALRYLKDGEVVGIFPEATISRSFEVKELKSGAARIAAQAGVPLIPVVLWGTQRLMTKDHPRDLSRGKTIGIRVGKPMYPTGADPDADTTSRAAAPRRERPRSPRRAARRDAHAARWCRRRGSAPVEHIGLPTWIPIVLCRGEVPGWSLVMSRWVPHSTTRDQRHAGLGSDPGGPGLQLLDLEGPGDRGLGEDADHLTVLEVAQRLVERAARHHGPPRCGAWSASPGRRSRGRRPRASP